MNVSRRQHLLHAATFWTAVGMVMAYFGTKWVWAGFSPSTAGIWLLVCVALGLAKGEYAIGKAGRRAIERIATLPDRSPIWQVFTPGQWGLVLGMMGLGMLIRFSGVPKNIRGLVLTVIGLALLWASRHFWNAANKS